jgi:hypothetical protein
MKHPLTMCSIALAAVAFASAQSVPHELSRLVAKARLPRPVMGWCRGDLEPAGSAPFAVAIGSRGGGRYLVLQRDGATVELATYQATPSLACYTPAQARKLNATLSQSETIEGQIRPRWSTTVVCGFVDNTTAVCWQYSLVERKFLRVGGWTT